MTTVHAQSAWRANRRRRPPASAEGVDPGRRRNRPSRAAAEGTASRARSVRSRGPYLAGSSRVSIVANEPDPSASSAPPVAAAASPTVARRMPGSPCRDGDQPPPDRRPSHAATAAHPTSTPRPRARNSQCTRPAATSTATGPQPNRRRPTAPASSARPATTRARLSRFAWFSPSIRVAPTTAIAAATPRAHAPPPHPRPARARAPAARANTTARTSGRRRASSTWVRPVAEPRIAARTPWPGRAFVPAEPGPSSPITSARQAYHAASNPTGTRSARSEYGSSQNTSPAADRPVAAASAPARGRQPPGWRPVDRGNVPSWPGLAAPVLTGAGRPGACGPRRRGRPTRSRPGRPRSAGRRLRPRRGAYPGRGRRSRTTAGAPRSAAASDHADPGRRASRLGRRRVHRADAQVSPPRRRAGELLRGVGGQSETTSGPTSFARPRGPAGRSVPRGRRRRRRERHVGTVVHEEQRAVPVGGLPEDLAPAQEVAGFGVLLAELDDVDARAEDRVQEVGQVAAPLAGVGADVEPGRDRGGPAAAPFSDAACRRSTVARSPPATARTSSSRSSSLERDLLVPGPLDRLAVALDDHELGSSPWAADEVGHRRPPAGVSTVRRYAHHGHRPAASMRSAPAAPTPSPPTPARTRAARRRSATSAAERRSATSNCPVASSGCV